MTLPTYTTPPFRPYTPLDTILSTIDSTTIPIAGSGSHYLYHTTTTVAVSYAWFYSLLCWTFCVPHLLRTITPVLHTPFRRDVSGSFHRPTCAPVDTHARHHLPHLPHPRHAHSANHRHLLPTLLDSHDSAFLLYLPRMPHACHRARPHHADRHYCSALIPAPRRRVHRCGLRWIADAAGRKFYGRHRHLLVSTRVFLRFGRVSTIAFSHTARARNFLY